MKHGYTNQDYDTGKGKFQKSKQNKHIKHVHTYRLTRTYLMTCHGEKYISNPAYLCQVNIALHGPAHRSQQAIWSYLAE